jgi:hypothetical protein
LENPPTTDSALHRSKRNTGKADISTLQESGHFYLALTTGSGRAVCDDGAVIETAMAGRLSAINLAAPIRVTVHL